MAKVAPQRSNRLIAGWKHRNAHRPKRLCVRSEGPGAVQHRGKAMLVEQPRQLDAVFSVAGHDAGAGHPPVVALPDADDLARVAAVEVVQRVVAGHARDARNQQWQRRCDGGSLAKHGLGVAAEPVGEDGRF